MVFFSLALVMIAFITAVFFTWYFSHKSNMQERRLMIEKGEQRPRQDLIEGAGI